MACGETPLALPACETLQLLGRELGAYSGVADEEFVGHSSVGCGSETGGVMFENGFSVRGGFADADGAGDKVLVDFLREIFLDFFNYLTGKICPAIVHGHDDAFEFEARVCAGASDFIEDADDFSKSFEAEPFALEGDEDLVRCGEGSGHEDTKRGWGIEDTVFEKIVWF